MTARRPPPQRRHKDCPARRLPVADQDDNDTRSYSAPGHMGGQFEDSGYSSGRGQFGFQHHVAPLPEWD